MKSQWNKWLADPGNIRVVSVDAGDLLRQLIVQQGLRGLAQGGYAEAIVGSLLIASLHKPNESVNMNAQGSGLFKQAIVDASPEGRVRGFFIEQSDPDLQTFGIEGQNGPWGSGILSILYTKNFEGKQPYKGMVAISTGYMDEAINDYYRDSEQLVSKVGMYIEFDGERLVQARGALVQALGGALPAELQTIEALTITEMRGLATLAHDQNKFIECGKALLGKRPFRLIENRLLEKFCTCSQERIERALVLTGEDDALEALGSETLLKMTCDFCRSEYTVSRERLKSLFVRDPSRLQ
jgi:molecular chaperone Hsp33